MPKQGHWGSYWKFYFYLLSVAIGFLSRSGTSLHQIELLNIAYQGERVSLCPRSNINGLPTRVTELHLLQQVTPKKS